MPRTLTHERSKRQGVGVTATQRCIVFAALVGFALAACGGKVVWDEDSDPRGGNGDGGHSGLTASGATTSSELPCGLTGVADPISCEEACDVLWKCGVLECFTAMNCPGFGESQETFFAVCANGCLEQGLPFADLVDKSDCPGALANLALFDPELKEVCQTGWD
jgi:hypothetical protein